MMRTESKLFRRSFYYLFSAIAIAFTATDCASNSADSKDAGNAPDTDTKDADPGDSTDNDTDTMTDLPSTDTEGDPCNGMPSLCEKRFDEVIYLTTHAAMAYDSPPFMKTHQEKSIRTQLDEGIRGLWLELHSMDGNSSLCLDDCSLGQLALNIALSDVVDYLDVNPRQVVSILLTSKIQTKALIAEIQDSVIAPWLGSLKDLPSLPTLEEIIQSEKRLFLFVDVATSVDDPDAGVDGGLEQVPPWLHFFQEHLWATRDDFTSVNEMNCNPPGGSSEASLYIVNHFLAPGQMDAGTTDVKSRAELVNQTPFLENRLQNCAKQHDQKPSFVVVDFFNKDVITAVNAVNLLQ
ncbi:MAG: hypothetical protein GY854_09835 [Deltaproteobacteria bacterium]|nr:hypothetical protein [Deltaproteobacteria bacterium]